jgi:hypothetical protein
LNFHTVEHIESAYAYRFMDSGETRHCDNGRWLVFDVDAPKSWLSDDDDDDQIQIMVSYAGYRSVAYTPMGVLELVVLEEQVLSNGLLLDHWYSHDENFSVFVAFDPHGYPLSVSIIPNWSKNADSHVIVLTDEYGAKSRIKVTFHDGIAELSSGVILRPVWDILLYGDNNSKPESCTLYAEISDEPDKFVLATKGLVSPRKIIHAFIGDAMYGMETTQADAMARDMDELFGKDFPF